jgi:hypothetical protein
MATVEELEKEINKIKERNRRVEKDKEWETSWTRKILIGFGTYFLVLLIMILMGIEEPFLSALVPSIAFFLSTASLEIIKKWWLKSHP